MTKQVLCDTQHHDDGSTSLHFAPEGQAFVVGRHGYAAHEAAARRANPTVTRLEELAEHIKAAHAHHATMSELNAAKEEHHERLTKAIEELPDLRDEHERMHRAVKALREEHAEILATVEKATPEP